MAGGHYLGQSWNVNKLKEGSSMSFKEGMKRVNDISKKHTFREISDQRKSDLKNIGKSTAPLAEVQRQTVESNRVANALNHSKLKRGFGKAALISGGLGLAAYGASKLGKSKD